MKIIFLFAVMFAFSEIVLAQDDMNNMPGMKKPATKNTRERQVSKVIYTCVMHPEVQMDKPGKCPKCGMTLVKKTIKVSTKPSQKIDNIQHDGMPHGQKDTLQHNEGKKDREMKMPDGERMPMNKMKMNRKENMDEIEIEKPKVFIQKGKTVRYDLYVADTVVNFTGKNKHAYAINGSIPAPTLVFTEGDTAEIYLHNMLKSEQTSLHWHGVILPNRFDGVPFLTTAAIDPGQTHLYKFAIVQNGTYWYHSHSKLQEQAGMYGALIFNKRTVQPQVKTSAAPSNLFSNHDYTLVLSEWTDEDPKQVQRRLRTGNDWYAIKKGSTQSYSEAIKQGYFKTKLTNEWKRMKAMDVSDVFYDRFLVNGRPETKAPEFKTGDKVNLHVVNGGASSYFWLQFAGGKITVVGNDGNDLQPVEVDRLIIAPAETYDLIVTIPGKMSYEFRATAEDRTGASSLWLGNGMKMPAAKLPKLKYFEGMKMMNGMMKVNGDMKSMDMQMSNQSMDMNVVMYPEITGSGNSGEMNMEHGGDNNKEMKDMKYDTIKAMKAEDSSKMKTAKMPGMTVSSPGMDMNNSQDIITLNYTMMRSTVKTSLPDGPTKILHFNLTGNMNRYVWTLDNRTVTEADNILINQGENVRLILTNQSMMRHPMHLHGHDFRILNGQGDYAPLKNVIDIMPMETDTIEFAANQSGNWFFHCHILYHMMAGMGRVFTYTNSPSNPELQDAARAYSRFKKDNTMKHLMAKVGLESNGTDGEAMLSTNRYALQSMWHLGTKPHHGYEAELNFGRYLGTMQWWFPYVGFDYHFKKIEGVKSQQADYKNLFGQVSDKDDRKTFVAGIQYVTPFLLTADARIDGNRKFRFQLGREDIPVSRRLRFNVMGNTDKEYAAGFRYIVSKWFAVSTHYDSDMGYGAGITLTY